MSLEEAEAHYGDEALAECARAAVSWYSTTDAAEKRLACARRGMASAARANKGESPARTVSEFLSLMKRPVAEWLGGVPGGPLVETDAPSEFAQDIVSETGGPDVNAEVEVVQGRIGEARKIFAKRPNGDEEYRRFRRFIIEHGYATLEQAQVGVLAAGIAPPDLFEEIPSSCVISNPRGAVFLPCPRCRWPMRRHGRLIQCEAFVCRSVGAVFQEMEGGLIQLGACKPGPPIPRADHLRLRRGVWRYTLQPGLVELDLEKRLLRIPGVTVHLWPDRDRYDLKIQSSASTWMVDVKDWSRASALAGYFLRNPALEPLIIVVPDWRADQVSLLRDRCRHLDLTFYTAKQFLTSVRSKTGQKRRRNAKAH